MNITFQKKNPDSYFTNVENLHEVSIREKYSYSSIENLFADTELEKQDFEKQEKEQGNHATEGTVNGYVLLFFRELNG